MQKIILDINPKGEIPFLYFSQYDNNRSFQVELVDGDEAYNVPSGYSVQLNVRKTDSKIVTKAPETIVGNIINFVTTEQMTACPGNNIASLTLKDQSDTVITTLYFIIEIQRDVLAGGLDSASEIDNLDRQVTAIINEIAPNVVSVIAEPIVENEAREAVGAIGGKWYRFALHVENTSEVIYVPYNLDGCIIDFYPQFFGCNITNVEELAFTDHSTTLRITYDNSGFPSITVYCYLHFFNPASF